MTGITPVTVTFLAQETRGTNVKAATANICSRQIYAEYASGTTTIRPELDAYLKSLRKGDTLIVWRLDRLGRSLGDLIHPQPNSGLAV